MDHAANCGNAGCSALVMPDRVYCGRHGGPARAKREAKEAERIRKAEVKKRLDFLRSRDPRRAQYRFRPVKKRVSPTTGVRT